MNTYTLRKGVTRGDKDSAYIMIHRIFNNTGEPKQFTALGTTIEGVDSSEYGYLTEAFAYAKQDNPKITEIVWSKYPAESLSALMFGLLEKQGYGVLRYASGEQLSVKFLKDPYHYEFKPGYRKTFVAFNLDGKLRVVHQYEADALKKDRPLFKADWVFGLSEFIIRFDRGNLQDNSVLVITYRGEEYQTREYVITNAIRKGFDSKALAALVDLLSTGKVVFAGMEDLYTGPCSTTPREMTISELAQYQHKAGRSADTGIQIGEDVMPRVLQYLDHIDPENLRALQKSGWSTRYRYDEIVGPIAKLS